MDAEQLRQYLEFYRDLGIGTLYRRESNNAMIVGQARLPTPTELR